MLEQFTACCDENNWFVAHVNAHNAHHGGQIVVIRKLQASWNREEGVS